MRTLVRLAPAGLLIVAAGLILYGCGRPATLASWDLRERLGPIGPALDVIEDVGRAGEAHRSPALLLGGIAAATLASEDMACIGTGLLAGAGVVGLLPGVLACGAGIWIGDFLLYLAGRLFGRPALGRRPLNRLLTREQVDAASRRLSGAGPAAIALSRFVPGTRLPVYFAAGALGMSWPVFCAFSLVAVAVWTPLLAGASLLVGKPVIGWFEGYSSLALAAVLLVAASIVAVRAVGAGRAETARQGGPRLGPRRAVAAWWGRLTRWEFWPPWLLYPPVVAYILWLGLRFRSLLAFTAANPAIPAGGFVGESKHEILRDLAAGTPGSAAIARTGLLPAGWAVREKVEAARRFMEEHALGFPVVLKPDAGQRGSGVAIVRTPAGLADYLERAPYDVLIQEYAPGAEFGVFYVRRPGEERGRIFAITEKRMPVVTGDGARSVRDLILADPRASLMARLYMRNQAHQLDRVPASGERVTLAELGTHCLGSIFLDGGWLRTDDLEEAIDRLSRGYRGFWFGRYDLRAADPRELQRGRGFKVIELNGVTSEATNIYDPSNGLLDAYRTLFAQWRLAFEIGALNMQSGTAPSRLADLSRQLIAYRRLSRAHPA